MKIYMPLNEDSLQNKLEWINRKNLNFEEHKNELLNQVKCLCGQYIRARLRRAGVLNRKVIQRLRVILEPSSHIIYEVFPALNSMGEELERMHPRLYTNVSRQLSSAPFGELQDGDQAPILLNLIAKELFNNNNNNKTNNNTTTNSNASSNLTTTTTTLSISNVTTMNTLVTHTTTTSLSPISNTESLSRSSSSQSLSQLSSYSSTTSTITWGKIISLFAVCGGFAIDCVRQGHYDYLQYLIDGMQEIFNNDDDLILWLTDHGGWLGLQQHIKQKQQTSKYLNINNMKFSITGWLTIFVLLSSLIYFLTYLLKLIGCHLYSLLV